MVLGYSDLPGAKVLFVGFGAHEVEVELVGVSLGEELATAGERGKPDASDDCKHSSFPVPR